MSDARASLTGHILEAAVRIMGARGAANVSLRDIAKEAGVALSQLHYYFGSREQLIVAAASHVMKRRMASLRDGLAKASSPAERISLAIRLIRHQLTSDPAEAQIRLELLTMAAWSPELAAATRELQGDLLNLILAESAQTVQERLRTNAAARVLLGALDGLALQTLQGAPEAEMDAAYATLESVLMTLVEA